MSNPTTPFSWQMPTSTDLVTDLPADFEVFGQAVATSMGDLLGGASGYVLSKASATDMDFTWIPNDQGDITGVTAGVGITGGGTSGTVTVTNDMATTITTAGDLVYGTGSGTYTRRGIGSTSQVLTVAGGVPTWATPSSGSMTLLSTTSMAGVSTVTLSSISGAYKNLRILIKDIYPATASILKWEVNSDTTAGNYRWVLSLDRAGSTLGMDYSDDNTITEWNIQNSSAENILEYIWLDYANTTTYKIAQHTGNFLSDFGVARGVQFGQFLWKNTSAITSIKFLNSASANFTAGSIELYGVN
jgi:hypothetical protein